MRFEAEVDSREGRKVWAAIEELAAGYLKEEVAATMDQARADAFADLILANAAVSTVVDLALPAGFATAGPARTGTCGACGRGPASGAGWRSVAYGRPWVVEEAAIGVLVHADQRTPDQRITGQAMGAGDQEGGRSAVFRVLAGLPAVGVLDQRAGTLTREMIEQIVFDPDTVFRRLVIDPDSGWVVDAGATTYHPGRQLARIVRKRDLRCRFPGCGPPARFCDLDHVIPYPLGRTVLANLACLCRRHHRLKTHGHWSLAISPVGVCTWAELHTGVVHTTEPADYRELAV
jgi:hypothetical protein